MSFLRLLVPLSLTWWLSSAHAVPANGSRGQGLQLNILILSTPLSGNINPTLYLSKKLASRVHNVTILLGTDDKTAAKLKEKSAQYSAKFQHFESTVYSDNQEIMDRMERDGLFYTLRNMTMTYSQELLQTLNGSAMTETYDVVIGDDVLVPSLLCIKSRWNIPTIFMGSSMTVYINEHPPWPWPGMALAYSSDNLSFSERMMSFVETVFVKRFFDYYLLSPQLPMLRSYCPSLTVDELYNGVGIFLPHIVPTVIGFEFSKTLTPLTSYVGPVIPDNPPPLSQDADLESWMTNRPDKSVIYLSMGSIFPLNKEEAKRLFEGVMKTNYSLLWALRKNNQEVLEGLDMDPKRVYISDWTPQFSVLASTIIHSAILHGGFNGLSEALWNGVPVIGFPQMVEQTLNVGRLYHQQLGLCLDKETLSSDKVAEAVNRIDSGNYRSNVKKLQKMFKLAGGGDRAVELIEFYGEEGYDHLIPAFAKYQWSWVQYYNADVWVLFVGGLGLVTFLVFKILRYCVLKLCHRKLPKEKEQ